MNVRGFAGILLANQIAVRLRPNKRASSRILIFASKGKCKEMNTDFFSMVRLVFIFFKLAYVTATA